jgi:hypothetical protein
MPIYSFYNNETDETYDLLMKYDEKKPYLDANPNVVEVFLKAPGIVGGTGDGGKVPDHFKEVMSRVADQNPYSPVAQQYGRKDAKSVKVRDAVDKVRKKIGGAIE